MRTIRNNGDPLVVHGSEGRREISSVDELLPFLQGRVTDPAGGRIGAPLDPGEARRQSEYEMDIQEATGEEVKRLEELDRLIQSSTLGFDNTVYERGVGRRTQGDIYEERNALIAEISARAVARQSEQERQERGSKGSPKPGPFEYAHGGSVMSFVKPKSRY